MTAPKYQHYFRILLCFLATTPLVGSAFIGESLQITRLLVASGVLLYGLIAYLVNEKYIETHEGATTYLAITDGLIITLAISEFDYNLPPSLLLMALLQFTSIAHGGAKRWVLTNIGVVIGFIIGLLILGNQTIDTQENNLANISLVISGIVYLCLYGFYSHRHTHSIVSQQNVLEEDIKRHKLRAYEISRYIPKPIWDSIQGKKKAKIERKPITIFFSDIVGFSTLSEELEADTLSTVLSSYLGEMSKVITQYNGTVDKFIGDAIMVTFGDDSSLSQGVKKDAIACVSMALSMGKRMQELQPTWAEMGIKKPLKIRMGINSGYCTVGTFGTSQHLDHTALGVHVNLASRLESAAKPDEILVSYETWSLIKSSILCKDKGKIKAKGFTHPIQVFQVINSRKELGGNQSYFSETTDGFSMHIDMQKINNYDRKKVISSLEEAKKQLQDKFPDK